MKEAHNQFQLNSVRPDGDTVLDEKLIARFVEPECFECGGFLKPSVVFFGDNCEPSVTKRAFDAVDEADAMLVIGTSLTVFSSYRLVRRALDRICPNNVAILNNGPTRADSEVHEYMKIEAPIMPSLTALLGQNRNDSLFSTSTSTPLLNTHLLHVE